MKVGLNLGPADAGGFRKSELRFTPEDKADEAMLVGMLDTMLLTDFLRPTDDDPPTIIFDCFLALRP